MFANLLLYLGFFFSIDYLPSVKKVISNGSLKESKLTEIKKLKHPKLDDSKTNDICKATK